MLKRVISTEKIPVKLWLDDLEAGAEAQARNVANLPFAFRHVAIMPDGHQGYGMPIGGVLATQGAVIPNAVGVDIGCGMCAVRTDLTEIDTESLKRIMGRIRTAIPVGFDHQKEAQDEALMPALFCSLAEFHGDPITRQQYRPALCQIGTLGGGNHFIEIQKGSDGHVWAMIHSGSRNIGLKVAKHYNELAVTLAEKWWSSIPKQWELAFLPFDSQEARAYLWEMQFCVEFALANRKLMMERVGQAFCQELGGSWPPASGIINIAHNYAAMENHFGSNVLVHRKGATRAREGEVGIIPGSQGTKSYIVRGKGNRESFESCSHGAGRRMGRKQACRELSLVDEAAKMDAQGIIHAVRAQGDLDEAPGAYKDIATVMANQEDLVDIVVELSPLGVIKA